MPASSVASASAWAKLRGKPSRMKPRAASRSARRSRNDAEHDLVDHQLAGVHGRFGPQTVLGAARHRAAQQVAGGDLRDAEMLDQTLRLGALARPRGPHKHYSHARNTTGRQPCRSNQAVLRRAPRDRYAAAHRSARNVHDGSSAAN